MEIQFKAWNKTYGKTAISRVYITVDGEDGGYTEMRSEIDAYTENEYTHTIDEKIYDVLTDIMIEDWETFYGEKECFDEHDMWELFSTAATKSYRKNSWTKKYYNEYKNGVEIEMA